MMFSGSGMRGQYDNGRAMYGPWDGPTGRLTGPELHEAMTNGIDRLMSVLIIAGDDVEPDNRVRLSPVFPVDEHGKAARVEMPFQRRTAATKQRRDFLARRATEILRGAGAKKVYRMDWAPLILHTQSSMRMGQSAEDSVLDASAETRAVKRLFIADNSALANSLAGPNPTLTTQALATRTSEVIFRRYFDGDPWVGDESPVESTDLRVSVALNGALT